MSDDPKPTVVVVEGVDARTGAPFREEIAPNAEYLAALDVVRTVSRGTILAEAAEPIAEGDPVVIEPGGRVRRARMGEAWNYAAAAPTVDGMVTVQRVDNLVVSVPPLARETAASEAMRTSLDRLLYGTSFAVDGQRVDPQDIVVDDDGVARIREARIRERIAESLAVYAGAEPPAMLSPEDVAAARDALRGALTSEMGPEWADIAMGERLEPEVTGMVYAVATEEIAAEITLRGAFGAITAETFGRPVRVRGTPATAPYVTIVGYGPDGRWIRETVEPGVVTRQRYDVVAEISPAYPPEPTPRLTDDQQRVWVETLRVMAYKRHDVPGWTEALPLPPCAATTQRRVDLGIYPDPRAWWYERERVRRATKRYSALTDGDARCPTRRALRRAPVRAR